MPQRFSEDQITETREILQGDRRKFWCYLCARPRERAYCPASARSQRKHNTVPRSRISIEQQIEFYLYQGGE